VYSAYIQIEKKSNFWHKVSNFNQKAPGRLAKMSHGQVIYDFFWCLSLAVRNRLFNVSNVLFKNTYTN